MRAPVATRKTLIRLAGTIWSLVGAALIAVAVFWFRAVEGPVMLAAGVAVLIGVAAWKFGFSRLVRKNLKRIRALAPEKDRVCLFAFQNARSYGIVIVMMVLGYTLRHSSLPRLYLAPAYLTMGVALLLGGLDYFHRS